MCGISGLIALSSAARGRVALARAAAAMSAALAHRGPDAGGSWLDPDGWAAFTHRRLAIVDLSPRGEQPMRRAGDGARVICFNGEIYNFRALRRELVGRGVEFRTETDTEVILAATRIWGMRGALERMDGAFAFALWDREERQLYLARDRAGEKPLIGAIAQGHLFFASELRALLASGAVLCDLDREAVCGYLELGYVPEPLSLVRGVFKLPAGAFTTIRVCESQVPTSARTVLVERAQRYWSLMLPEVSPLAKAPLGGLQSAMEHAETLLATAVREQLDCDVPVGVFLSGGIDSALVAAQVRRVATRRVDAFTVKFGEAGFDESAHASAIARHLGLEHHVLELAPDELLYSIPEEAALADEPTANASYFAVLAMSRLAKRHVTVVLSGDGGDEVFAGYNRYRQLLKLFAWRRTTAIRLLVSGLLRAGIRLAGTWNGLERLLLKDMPQAQLATVLSRVARFFEPARTACAYRATMQLLDKSERVALGVAETTRSGEDWPVGESLLRSMLREDFLTYLCGDNLAKVDRASMRAGLEVRLPLLDRELIEFAWAQPEAYLIRGRQSKLLLRELLARHVPRELFERPKMGFTVPVGAWLRGPLREWQRGLLLDRDACRDVGLDVRGVTALQARLEADRNANARGVWGVAMLLAWHRGLRADMARRTADGQLEHA